MRIFRLVIAVVCISALIAPTFALPNDFKSVVSDQITKTAAALIQNVPKPEIGSVGGEWLMIGLARSDEKVPDSFVDGYYDMVKAALAESGGVLASVKYTEYSRLILALTALGYDVTDVGGYNLLEKLADFDTLIKQGINGPIYALIALDSHAYEIPAAQNVTTQTTRQRLIDYILARECTDADGSKGGFSLGTAEPQIDMTAMALQVLSRYTEQPNVAAATERGLLALSKLEANPSNLVWNENSAESAAQTIVAKAALRIDAYENVTALLKYALVSGGFSHDNDDAFDLMATEQAFYALVAYDRYINGKPPLYDMSDVSIRGHQKSDEISVVLNGIPLSFEQPPVNEGGWILVPMRAIFEALGANVEWETTTKTVTGTRDGHVIVLKIGESYAQVDGKQVALDVPSQLIGGKTMVSLHFISESFDAQVYWDTGENKVYVNE